MEPGAVERKRSRHWELPRITRWGQGSVKRLQGPLTPGKAVPLRPLALTPITALTRVYDRLHFLTPGYPRAELPKVQGSLAPSPDRKFLERAPPSVVRWRCAGPFMARRAQERQQEFGIREEPGCSCHRLTFPFGLAFLNTLWREREERPGLAYPTQEKAPAGHPSAGLRTRGLE